MRGSLDLLLLILCDLERLDTMVFDRVLQHQVFAEVLVTFLPHLVATDLIVFLLQGCVASLQYLLKFSNSSFLALQLSLDYPVWAGSASSSCQVLHVALMQLLRLSSLHVGEQVFLVDACSVRQSQRGGPLKLSCCIFTTT